MWTLASIPECYLSHVRIDQPKRVWISLASHDKFGRGWTSLGKSTQVWTSCWMPNYSLFFMFPEGGREAGGEERPFIDILIITQLKETFLFINYVDVL